MWCNELTANRHPKKAKTGNTTVPSPVFPPAENGANTNDGANNVTHEQERDEGGGKKESPRLV